MDSKSGVIFRSGLHILQKSTARFYNNQFKALPSCETVEDKIVLLEHAKTLPLYKDHRSNFFFTGAWGRTNSLKIIEEQIVELEEIKSRPSI